MSHTIRIGDTDHVLEEDRLRVVHKGDTVLDVSLSPAFDGEKVAITAWEKAGDNSYLASLGKYGSAFLEEDLGRLVFRIETSLKQFEHVTCLSDGIISGDSWRTFSSDEHERLWDKKVDANVPVSSAYAELNSPDGCDEVNGGMTDPADMPPLWIWNVPVRAFALRGKNAWLGVSIPGPWGIGVTRFNMHRTRFSLRFESLHTGCTSGKMPAVYFCPGLTDGFDALDEHRRLSEQLGLMDLEPKKHPHWWSHPIYKYWDEWERQAVAGEITGESRHVIRKMEEWTRCTQEKLAFKELTTTMEQYCFRHYGDYRPSEVMGTEEEVQDTIDAWHKQGVRVGHYIHPFVVNTKVALYREHPEAFCRPRNKGFFMTYPLEPWDRDNPQFAPVDWTHPAGREFMLKQVEYLIAPRPRGRDCDMLCSNNWRSPDPRHYDFHDPDWGVGDMMTYKVQKLMYERAKAVKPHCAVAKVSALDCYMQPTYDILHLCEDWTHDTQNWYRRARLATRLVGNRLFWTCSWFCTRTKGDEYYSAMLAWSIPETESVRHAVHCYYPRWLPLGEKRFRRRKAGVHAYLHSPPEASDECRVNWAFERLEISRRKTSGPLAGWYGALALSPRCFVTYSETEARIASAENRLDRVPLPPGAKLEAVTRVLHDGGEEACEYTLDREKNAVELFIQDCGGETFYYSIAYTRG
ncbi:hypothetical protein ACFLSJ_01835 [Verrucomicrobiota bacterium]